jgi:hypothetical protein
MDPSQERAMTIPRVPLRLGRGWFDAGNWERIGRGRAMLGPSFETWASAWKSCSSRTTLPRTAGTDATMTTSSLAVRLDFGYGAD